MMTRNTNDPYAHCEERCTHDLGKGVLIVELLGIDGPHPSVFDDVQRHLLGRELRARLINQAPAA
jgi:hypothetical protein